jgi:hypothetical protein
MDIGDHYGLLTAPAIVADQKSVQALLAIEGGRLAGWAIDDLGLDNHGKTTRPIGEVDGEIELWRS